MNTVGRITVLLLALAVAATWASAAGGGGGPGSRAAGASPQYDQAVAFIQAEQWKDAIPLLQSHLQRARNDADAHNWLAYALRKSGQLEAAFTHYRRALALEPTHLGAHEYIGEAYLLAGQPALAQFHLDELARICNSNCEEFLDLQKAIVQYRRAKPS